MISNSTPIILLSKINRLILLKKLFSQIIIPEEVSKEVLIEDKPGYLIINRAIKDGWIKIENPKNNLELGLGKGENSAINLARERKDKLIIDDALGVKAAKAFNIEILRTTTLIFMALEKKLLKKDEAILVANALIENGYYIAPKYYSAIITKLNTIK